MGFEKFTEIRDASEHDMTRHFVNVLAIIRLNSFKNVFIHDYN